MTNVTFSYGFFFFGTMYSQLHVKLKKITVSRYSYNIYGLWDGKIIKVIKNALLKVSQDNNRRDSHVYKC